MEIKQSLHDEIIQAATDYLKIGEVSPIHYQNFTRFLKDGNRLAYEDEYFARRRQISVMAMATYLEPNDVKLKFLENVLWEVCNEYTWALPAHLPIEKEQFRSDSPFWIDLFSAETAETLAEIKELLPQLDNGIKKRISYEINQRILIPFTHQSWGWETNHSNWSAVIGGSLGIVALLELPRHSNQQQQIIERLDGAMESYLAGFKEDGACEEGVGYWGYGFGYFIYYGEMLSKILNDTRYLDREKVKKIASFPGYTMIRPGEYLPFSDYSTSELPTGLLAYCQKKFGVNLPTIKKISDLDFDSCYRFAHILRNYQWTTKESLTETVKYSCHFFPQTQWLNLRNPKVQLVFGAKGGNNHESHNQNDLGSFIIGDNNQLFLTDLGAGEYTRDYFQSDTRYNYLVNSSLGHSVPIVNNQLQVEGQRKAINVGFFDNTFSLELQEAYSCSELLKLQRTFKIDEDKRQVILTDCFEFNKTKNSVIENFVTEIKPIIKEKSVLLLGERNQCEIHFPNRKIQVEEKVFKGHAGENKKAYLIQFRKTIELVDVCTIKFELTTR